jgi:hypothetical protein
MSLPAVQLSEVCSLWFLASGLPLFLLNSMTVDAPLFWASGCALLLLDLRQVFSADMFLRVLPLVLFLGWLFRCWKPCCGQISSPPSFLSVSRLWTAVTGRHVLLFVSPCSCGLLSLLVFLFYCVQFQAFCGCPCDAFVRAFGCSFVLLVGCLSVRVCPWVSGCNSLCLLSFLINGRTLVSLFFL